MTGPKLNERSYVAGERSGTKATAKYVRTSASKARVVLDLVRGLDVNSADEVLQFTERHVARDVRKVLASAVANAVNNDEQDADELYIVACFADEGPTLRRFRPRARGRASRINKRSCHITVIVARMSDERIEIITARQERAGGGSGRGRPQSSSASRKARVERSRAKEAADAGDEVDTEATEVDETTVATDGADVEVTESDETTTDDAATDVADEATAESDDTDQDQADDAEETDNVTTPDEGSATDEGAS
ncbi:MAG: 50S ribosomal protein L22 [Ilumatobacteraceae bacterium]|nr:50S ribosomal protein L22 [Ilumatobacteraceae bacterium]